MIKWKNIRNFCDKSIRFGLFIPGSNLLLVYGRWLFPSWVLKFFSKKRNLIIEKKICNIISGYTYQSAVMHFVPNAPIWYFWAQGEDCMPDIPRLCLQSIRKFSNGHPIFVLTGTNFQNYVNIPSHIIDLYHKGNITPTHFSDILRMGLLTQKGGFWIDATMLITKPLPEEIFNRPIFSIKNSPFGYFVSKCRWTGFCMASWNDSILAKNVYNIFCLYWEKEDFLIDYFLIDYVIDLLYRSNKEIRDLIEDIPYNNENVHKLAPLLCDTFNEELFRELTKDTFLFKLNWRKYTTEELNRDSNNYYHYLVKWINSPQ